MFAHLVQMHLLTEHVSRPLGLNVGRDLFGENISEAVPEKLLEGFRRKSGAEMS